MADVEIKFNTGNAAFAEMGEIEIGRIVKEIGGKIERGHTNGIIRDINGNQVGQYYAEVSATETDEEI